jgi:Fe-S-cluster-containing dehydrogenase component
MSMAHEQLPNCPFCRTRIGAGSPEPTCVVFCPMCGGFWVRLHGRERKLTPDEMRNLRNSPVAETILTAQERITARMWG